MLAFTLTAFLELMDHGIVSWDMVSITFIKQVRLPNFRLSFVTRCSLGSRGDAGNTAAPGRVGLLAPRPGFSSSGSGLPVTPGRCTETLLYSQGLR